MFYTISTINKKVNNKNKTNTIFVGKG